MRVLDVPGAGIHTSAILTHDNRANQVIRAVRPDFDLLKVVTDCLLVLVAVRVLEVGP
jgi:hypothetical protein